MVMHLLPHRWRRSSRLIAPVSAEPSDSASSASASVERATAILSRNRRSRLLTSTVEAMSGACVNEEEHLYSFCSRSLYREPRIAMITVTTQLMSWLLVLPNSVVWTWSDSIHEKAQAYLSSTRCWVLILILCNTLWNCVTRVSERYAYEVNKRTYLTSIDIISIGAIVSFWQRHVIFSMCEIKWSLEHQRINDVMSFQGGYIAHGNTFSLALDSREITPWTVLAVLYGPLLRILGLSLLLIALLMATKAVYLESKRFRKAKSKQLRRQVSAFFKRISIDVSLSGPETGMSVMPVRSDIPPDAYEDSDDDDMQYKDLRVALSQPYKRLPLEEWLDQPIRATSLIRNGLYMEAVRDNTRFIRPGCYLDFGIIVKHGVIHSRFGFSDPWKPKMTVEEYMAHVEYRTQRSTERSPNFHGSALNTQPDVSAHIEAVQRLSMDAGRRPSRSQSSHINSNQVGSARLMSRKKSLDVPLS
ncbi:hypothetical protein Poli38472_005756 [Pythium oligandrum]|uniref:Uncharacterized protein n=1 Tax=Pythium oligandrum TaxID=41045 RepID=A0A8K1CU28_PYTOL|nr:hypothetical protein Poli38472_005756 [Pythium oligandrum]|eukprot:TMW68288.1 hypothetical protein Poli38472_005756 [Pythium oligandrum]